MEETTSIQIRKSTHRELRQQGISGDSMDDIIQKLLKAKEKRS